MNTSNQGKKRPFPLHWLPIKRGNGTTGNGLALRKPTAVTKGKYIMFGKLFFESPLRFIWRIVEAFGYYAEWDADGRFYLARLSSLEENAEK